MIKYCPKILFWSWTEPDKPSGSPAILLEILRSIPKGRAEIVCERNCPDNMRKNVDLVHPITRLSAHRKMWPFSRGYRFQRYFVYMGVIILLLYGLFKIIKNRPDFIFTIYFNDKWILSSYLLSKLTGIPIIYYVHDPYLESAVNRQEPAPKLANWLEPLSLQHGQVIVLYESLRRHYLKKYDIESVVVRHITPKIRNTYKPSKKNDLVTIGFAGMIYDNNKILMKKLGLTCRRMPNLRLRIFTAANSSVLEEIGLYGDRIKVEYIQNYEELLDSLSKCDLLYLPLAFPDETSLLLPESALKYVLPTKAIDYLLAGPPILVHCPKDYETSRFFVKYCAGFQLNSNRLRDINQWIENWQDKGKESIDEKNVLQALDTFSAEKNFTILENMFSNITK